MIEHMERVAAHIAAIDIATEKILTYTAGMSANDYFKNDPIQDAVNMRLATIGEAANKLRKDGKEIIDKNPEIEWELM